MGKVTIEEWAKLYEKALKIKEIKPWEYFSFLDTITIKLPEREEMYYVSIDDHYDLISISIMRDIVTYTKFIETNLNTDLTEIESFDRLYSIDIFSVCIGKKEAVSKKQLKIIKELGLTFSGKQDWIFFMSKRKGYVPTDPDQHEVLFMTECLEQIYQATVYYLRKQMDINFDEGYSLCRYFNDDEKKWLTLEKKVKLEKEKIEFYTYTNEIQLQKVKRMPITNIEIELDITFVMSKITDDNKKDAIVRLIVIADKKEGLIIAYKIILPSDNIIEETFELLFKCMEKVGKISNIYYKNDICEGIVYDFCTKAGINISKENYLPTISRFLENILEQPIEEK